MAADFLTSPVPITDVYWSFNLSLALGFDLTVTTLKAVDSPYVLGRVLPLIECTTMVSSLQPPSYNPPPVKWRYA